MTTEQRPEVTQSTVRRLWDEALQTPDSWANVHVEAENLLERANAAQAAGKYLGSGRISIVLDASVRGRGLGRRVISLACAADGGPVVAEILVDNRASRACFEAAGFVRELTPAPPGARPAPAPLSIAGEPRPVIRYLWRPDRAHAR